MPLDNGIMIMMLMPCMPYMLNFTCYTSNSSKVLSNYTLKKG